MHAEIIFYSANGCGFCVKAKQMLKDQIASGKIIMKDAKEAPKGVRGFPFFESVSKNGKTHTGLPPSAAALMQKLGGGKGKSSELTQCSFQSEEANYGCPQGTTCTTVDPNSPPYCLPSPPPPPFVPGCDVTGCPTGQKCDPKTKKCVTSMIYKPSLTTADIVGIVIASVAGVALIVALGFLIAKAAKKGKKGRKSRK